MKVQRQIVPKITGNDPLISHSCEHIRSWRRECLPPHAFHNDLKFGAEDQDLLYRLHGIGHVMIIPDCLINFRRHNNSLMSVKATRTMIRSDHYVAKLMALARRRQNQIRGYAI